MKARSELWNDEACSWEITTDPGEFSARVVMSADKESRRVDTIVKATERGEGRLEDVWRDGTQGYFGVATAGYPNAFHDLQTQGCAALIWLLTASAPRGKMTRIRKG